ncbi:MAG: AtpZ/AtpI family protein [Candidatus Andersenbacteria bacterium]
MAKVLPPNISPEKKSGPAFFNLWVVSGEIGLLLAIPLVVLILLGIKVDRALGTTPLFIIGGMIVSMVLSSVAIARKIRRVSKE